MAGVPPAERRCGQSFEEDQSLSVQLKTIQVAGQAGGRPLPFGGLKLRPNSQQREHSLAQRTLRMSN
jgi:hypothetical protein